MINVAIVGSRGFPELRLVRELVSLLPKNVHVISGGAYGPDSIAASIARARGLRVSVFPADWATYGKSAGPKRNTQIVELLESGRDCVFAFWDGSSHGTNDVIEKATLKKVTVEVVYPDCTSIAEVVRRVNLKEPSHEPTDLP
jgi:hypothetical protein